MPQRPAQLNLSNLPSLTMLGDPIDRINITSFGYGEPSPRQQWVRTLNLWSISVYACDGHLVTSHGFFFHDVGEIYCRWPATSVPSVSGAAIGIICKAPQPGRSKTRLAMAIGEDAASELSACFLRDVAAAIEGVPEVLGRRGYGVYAPAGAEHIMLKLLPAAFGLLLQAGDDLGHVLLGATRALLDAGHDCVLLVNGDSPTLPSRLLVQAVATLREPGDRMVLGPASDGGYYLIGLKHPHKHLFTRIAWGTETVARSTCERADEIGLATTLLPEWYDVDDVKTLRWLQDELAGRSTRFRAGGLAAASRSFLKAAPQIDL